VYLLHTGEWKDAESALNFYALSRTKNMKGVTIPSQRRWVRYYETMLKREATGQIPVSKSYRMKSVFVSRSAPSFTEIVVFDQKKAYHLGMLTSLNTSDYNHPVFKEGILLKCPLDLIIHKDVKVQWNLRGRVKKGKKRAFSLWFNTDFIGDNNTLWFAKENIDKVNKVKKLSDFFVCFEFEPLNSYKVTERGENSLDLSTFKDPEQLASFAGLLYDGIQSQNRQWKGKMSQDGFRAHDAVLWLMEEGGVKNVEDAVEIGERLRFYGLIKVLSKEGEDEEIEGRFENTNQLWRFAMVCRKVSSITAEERKENSVVVRGTHNYLEDLLPVEFEKITI